MRASRPSSVPMAACLLAVLLADHSAAACGVWSLHDAELARDVEFLCAGFHLRAAGGKGVVAAEPIRGSADLYTFEWKDPRQQDAWRRVVEVMKDELRFRGKKVGTWDRDGASLGGSRYQMTLSPVDAPRKGYLITVTRGRSSLMRGVAFPFEGETDEAHLDGIRRRVALYLVWRAHQLLPSLRTNEAATIPVLLRQLRSGRPGERFAAAVALGRIGAAAVPLVSQVIADKRQPEETRLEAIFAVGSMGAGGASAVPVLEAALQEPPMKAAARAAIAKIRAKGRS